MATPDPDAIHLIGPDDFVTCPVCSRRSDTLFTVVGGITQPALAEPAEDEDGPIFKARCPDHGDFRWQVDTTEEESE